MNLLKMQCLLYSDGNNFRHGSLLAVGKLQPITTSVYAVWYTFPSQKINSYELRNQTVGPPKSGTILLLST